MKLKIALCVGSSCTNSKQVHCVSESSLGNMEHGLPQVVNLDSKLILITSVIEAALVHWCIEATPIPVVVGRTFWATADHKSNKTTSGAVLGSQLKNSVDCLNKVTKCKTSTVTVHNHQMR